MFIWTFLLRITHTIISQSIADSSWIILYITRLASNEIFSPSNIIYWKVGRAKDLSAPLYNTLFICVSNNILLKIGFIFSVFLGPDEQCRIWNVRLQGGQWQAKQSQGGYVILTAIKSPSWNQIRPDKMWEKHYFAFSTVRYAGERGTFNSILNLRYFIQAAKFRWPTPKFMWPPNFPSILLPLRNKVWPPWGPYGPRSEPLV